VSKRSLVFLTTPAPSKRHGASRPVPAPLPTSHRPPPTAHRPLPTAHFPLPTSHFPLPTSHSRQNRVTRRAPFSATTSRGGIALCGVPGDGAPLATGYSLPAFQAEAPTTPSENSGLAPVCSPGLLPTIKAARRKPSGPGPGPSAHCPERSHLPTVSPDETVENHMGAKHRQTVWAIS
jgi:hypothetical protein